MKRIIIFSILILAVLVSCKTSKKAQTADSKYQTTLDQGAQAKVFSVPETTSAKPATTTDTPVTVRKEDVSFTQQEDQLKNDVNSYFVIVGSFSNIDNAKKYRETLVSEGFTPIILQSNTSGYFRVCVNSYKNEAEARTRVQDIRKNFPKYYDSWLLIKQ
jgi:cell division protein FtsN